MGHGYRNAPSVCTAPTASYATPAPAPMVSNQSNAANMSRVQPTETSTLAPHTQTFTPSNATTSVACPAPTPAQLTSRPGLSAPIRRPAPPEMQNGWERGQYEGVVGTPQGSARAAGSATWRGSHSQLGISGEGSMGEWSSAPGQTTTGLSVGANLSARAGTGTDGSSGGGGLETSINSPGASATRTTTTDGNGRPTNMYGASFNPTPGGSAGAYASTGPNPNGSGDLRARASVGMGTGFGVRFGQTDVDQDGVRENCIGADVEWFSGDVCVEGTGMPGQASVDRINRVANQEEAARRLARNPAATSSPAAGTTVRERQIQAEMSRLQTERDRDEAARRANFNPNDPMNFDPTAPTRAANVRAGGPGPQFVPLNELNSDGTPMSPADRMARDLRNGVLAQ